ncbi:hypothetical protein CANCADRAFT_88761 [Tortispora caseinolytica NRRL Y-17796]|uniref:Vacuolar protein-sorting-associated protein 46 n=1 Tax=Tortispora caseinolytica NRRL Y-17796 TaxID=767744 RepID=A0A1E4TLD8_9ASCO|nr:hypothetical protein CANCADRAFT_88761 [Tortispora caseinolytica NRRL Y-17796]
MSGLENSLFQLKFTAKQLKSQSSKTAREIEAEKKKVKKAIQEGNSDIARIYAENVVRKQSERMNLLRLSSRIDSVASRVQTAVTMKTLSKNMAQVVKSMDRAMENMNLEVISQIMDKFETQFEDLDVSTSYYEGATGQAAAISVPQDEVDLLMQSVADEAGLEMKQNMQSAPSSKVEPTEVEEDNLGERLRALRS